VIATKNKTKKKSGIRQGSSVSRTIDAKPGKNKSGSGRQEQVTQVGFATPDTIKSGSGPRRVDDQHNTAAPDQPTTESGPAAPARLRRRAASVKNNDGSGQISGGTQYPPAAPSRKKAASDHLAQATHTNCVAAATNEAESDLSGRDTHSRVVASATNHAESGQSLSDNHSAFAASAQSTSVSGHAVSAHHHIDATTDTNEGASGQIARGSQCSYAAALVEPTRQLRAVIDLQIALNNRIGALARQMLGPSCADLADTKKRAAAMLKAITKGKPTDECRYVVAFVSMMVQAQSTTMKALDEQRKTLEKHVCKIIEDSPVWKQWAEPKRGVGSLTLAKIIGETGDLKTYSNPAKVWKRMGLAVCGGTRQGNAGKGATAADWEARGYSPRRRSLMWNFGDCQIKTRGAYRDLYDARKAEQNEVTMPDKYKNKMHAHLSAQRYMEKRFLKELWGAWKHLM
jgi:hypothetical protein